MEFLMNYSYLNRFEIINLTKAYLN